MFFLALCVVYFTYYFYKKIRMDESVKDFANVVPGPPLLPIIGNLSSFISNDLCFAEMLQNNWEKYGNRFRLIILNKPILITSDVKDIETIIANTTHKADVYTLFLKKFLGNCLMRNSAEMAKMKRKILVPTLHAEVLSNYTPILEKCVYKFIKKMENLNGSLNITELGQLFSLDIVTEATTGVEMNAMDFKNSDYVTAFKGLLHCWDARWKSILHKSDFFYFNFSEFGKNEQKHSDILTKFCDDIVAARREIIESNTVFMEGKKIATIDALLMARDENGNKLDDETISHEIRLILMGGHDTIYTTLALMAYEVAKQPDIQEIIYQEQLEIFGDNNDTIASLQEVQKMKYLEMAIRESLRLHSVAPTIGRKATKDIQFDGFILPKDSNIFVNLYNMGRNPDIFPNPTKFDPQRFNPNSIEYKNRSPLASIPFSYGSRICIGQAFAMWEMKSLFSSIIRKYTISPSEKHEVELAYGLLKTPKNGLYIDYEIR